MIQALPDEYMEEMNQIDLIIGQPLLFNYYTIFSVQEGKIGFYEADYFKKERDISLGALLSILLFICVFISGILGCIGKYVQSRKKQNYRVLAREKSLFNKNKIVEEKGWDDVKLFEQRLIKYEIQENSNKLEKECDEY